MTLIYALLFGALAVVAIRLVFPGAGRRISASEFEHWVHSFSKVKKDGGIMTLSHAGTPVFLRFRRTSGTDHRCCLLVDVPRTDWSEPHLHDLRAQATRLGLRVVEPADDLGLLLRVPLEVPDIWNPASGAEGARLAVALFEALGVDRTARFNVAMSGENSLRTWSDTAQRWQEGDNPVLRRIGERIKHEAERDEEQ